MSLYIGNLSARTRKDELERVFQRYGQCDVRIKDRYGFVVYDFPPDAETALSALRGRNICGQQLTITWSNKQPRTFQRPARGARSYESRGRDSSRRKKSNDWREQDYRSGFKQPDSDGERLNSEDMHDEGRDYHQENMIDNDYVGEENHALRQDLPRGGGDVVTELADNGRWGQQIDDQFNDKDGMTFDHYEPYMGYDRKDKDENRWGANSGGSALGSSQDNVGREQDGDTVLPKRRNDPKFQQNCFSCGALGHKMRDCPRKHSSRRELTRFDRSQDNDINKSRDGGELERFGSKSRGNMRPSRPTRLRRRSDKWTSDSGKLQISMRNDNSHETGRVQGKEHGAKKRSKRDTRSPKRQSAKKSKRLASPPFHSEYNASRSHSASQSSKSLTRSLSRSRSRSRSVSAARSLSSTSRSHSKSRYSKSRSSKSRSRSSSPTSLSLSVSLGRPASSPSKPQLNRKESVDQGTTPKSGDIQGQHTRLIENAYSKNTNVATETAAVNCGNVASASEVEDHERKNQHLQGDKTSPPEIGATGTEPSPPQLSRDRTTTKQDSGTLNIYSGHKPSISLEEMCMALKHYGVELPEESEKHASLEAFFGSARLWPWESIYYRRVKKGPISVENYAKRVAQNEKFGIVDKYIRSSSGWGEIYMDNA